MITMRPASEASEAVTSHGLFGVSKKRRRKHFVGFMGNIYKFEAQMEQVNFRIFQ